MKKSIFAIFLSLLIGSKAIATEPAQWHENDWVKFIDAAVWGSLGDAYSAAGGRFPLVDAYSALSASASAVKPGLQLWLRKKMARAYAEENFTPGDRYNAFYSCLTWNSCEELRELESGVNNIPGRTTDFSGCSKDELTILKKLGFTLEEIESHCRPIAAQGEQNDTAGNFSGRWKTNWGMMTLNKDGSGSYTHDKGKITASISGRVLTGTWSEAPSYSPPNDAGDVEFTLSKDGNNWSGKWRYGSRGNWKSDWHGSRVK
jgi:hypothetical protein